MDRDGTTYERQLSKLRKDLGEVFLAALEDPETVEIVLNADGTLWQERLGATARTDRDDECRLRRGRDAYHRGLPPHYNNAR